ncbi:uncharacterized protein N7511_007062 [Penicillium nucicola]|uniref:uncharacterized protein n=1 Tax=Penicillium nucicola TaxID=1850975 RepID=UPI0025459DE7|nr:uncharacterized protein N7511_007062 [Penicillium nucicola]KAJ5756880.1 hypothetical protein N7511_007062 [Penicillium nucicola]
MSAFASEGVLVGYPCDGQRPQDPQLYMADSRMLSASHDAGTEVSYNTGAPGRIQALKSQLAMHRVKTNGHSDD